MLPRVSFFIDRLTIPSILSMEFQKDHINPVDSVRCISKIEFEKIPSVTDLLSKSVDKDCEHSFQGIKLSDLKDVKEQVASQNNYFAGLVWDWLLEHLQREEESEQIIKNLSCP